MKDFSISEEERDEFILNYTIEDNNIIVRYADGGEVVTNYTKENEGYILDKMAKQVRNSDDAIDEYKHMIKYYIPDLLFIIPFLQVLGISIDYFLGGEVTISNAFLLSSINLLPGILFGRGVKKILYYNSKLDDIYKNRLFQENSFMMNFNMKVNDNYLENVSDKTKEIIKSIPEDKPLFTYNTIDDMKTSDIEQIIYNIDYERNNNGVNDTKKRIRKR